MNEFSNIKRSVNELLYNHILLNITDCLCSIVNGYIAGNFLDTIAISFSSLINPFSRIVLAISMIFSSSSEILCGKFMGLGDKKSINKTFTYAFCLALIFGFIFFAFVIISPEYLLHLLGAPAEVVGPLSIYLRAYSVGIIASIIRAVFVTFLHMENEGKYITASVILLTVVYIVCGYAFIKVFQLSYFGFGLTYTVSQVISLIFLIIRFCKNRKQINFDFGKFEPSFALQMFIIGIPEGLHYFLISVRNLVLNQTLVTTGGLTAVAAKSVSNSCLSAIDSITISITQTFTILASIYIGEKNKIEFKRLIKYFSKYIFPIEIGILVLHAIFVKPLVGVFTNDPANIGISINAFLLYLPSVYVEMIVDILISVYVIFGYKLFVNFANVFHSIILHLGFTIVFEKILSYYSVFAGYIFTEIFTFLIIFIFAAIKRKSIPKNLYDLSLIEQNVPDGITTTFVTNKNDEVIDISRSVSEFCLNNSIDKRRANLCGLCVEETLANIFEHGYTKKDIKDKRIDTFVEVDNNSVIIRIRDNSVPFDPTTRFTTFNPEDPAKNVGIRLLSKIANEITYQNLFGINNLIIKI